MDIPEEQNFFLKTKEFIKEVLWHSFLVGLASLLLETIFPELLPWKEIADMLHLV